MSGLLDLLNSPMGKQLISGVAGQTGQPENKTADVMSMAMPLILGAMKKNVSSSPQGAEGLMSALSSKHDGSILDNLGGLFGGGVDDSVMSDGAGILGHVFGNKQPQVESALSQKSGLDAGSVASILKIAAPIVMGFLAKQKSESNVSDANGLNSLLGGMLGGQPAENQSLITTLLDADGDGSILDDVAGMVMGGSKKKGGLGGLLGGLFGK
ncbi:DUF937 domain-containing protein [Maribacter polysiphoniae]|uniref:DUF937 domain-containing protein n=2 Tax=Maribacter TaxID=252356 RepID=A0A316DVH1_9FLAO|nr:MULTISPECIES: DUF937 domain-containing protein [Maribacter]MBD0776219.1 DUF937 domain-containing protein [Maribacter aquimaris]MBD1262509.1 DUF937 domain-containing protein [Maribacter polysiphoniae]PWK21342.1 uncharacterized protein DUF937 [Maribacter polysiphoniae]